VPDGLKKGKLGEGTRALNPALEVIEHGMVVIGNPPMDHRKQRPKI